MNRCSGVLKKSVPVACCVPCLEPYLTGGEDCCDTVHCSRADLEPSSVYTHGMSLLSHHFCIILRFTRIYIDRQ